MGDRGPMPELRSNLVGHRSKDELAGTDLTQIEVTPGYYIPRHVDPEWHDIAKNLYKAALTSPVHRRIWLGTDWELFYSVMDDLSFAKKNQGARGYGVLMQVIYSATSMLLLSEGDRRRAKIETIAPQQKTDENEEVEAAYAGLDD